VPTSRRIARLEQLILETVAVALQREVHDPRIGIVTVTRVRLAPDLSHATVWWSCLGDEVKQRTTERGLTAATKVVQSRVAKAMGTRITPTVVFRFDVGLEKAQRLEGLFDQIRTERGDPPPRPDDPPAGDEDVDPDDEGEGGGEAEDDEAPATAGDAQGDAADDAPDDDSGAGEIPHR
jgi:ribosome-binding factor A